MYLYNTFETKSELFFFFFYFVKFYPLGPSPFLKYFLYKHVWVKFLIFQGLLFFFNWFVKLYCKFGICTGTNLLFIFYLIYTKQGLNNGKISKRKVLKHRCIFSSVFF